MMNPYCILQVHLRNVTVRFVLILCKYQREKKQQENEAETQNQLDVVVF